MDELQPDVSKADYLSKDERAKLDDLRKKLTSARDLRNAPRDEFDGLGYLDAYDRDAQTSMAYIAPRKNQGEAKVSTGTTRQSLVSLISRAVSYNYSTEFKPYGKNGNLLSELGAAIEVMVQNANDLSGDDDQIKVRANELFAHGDVIVYEDFVTRYGKEKTRLPLNGKISGVTWTEKKMKVFEGCERRTVPGRRFYFGDIFTDTIDNQPCCFEVNYITMAEARQKYGDWERFEHVKPRGKDGSIEDKTGFADDWRLEDAKNEDLEEILYVSVPDNEMQILLGGVPMLPFGFPSRWDHGKYPWAHQGAEQIRTGFIYHRSFVRTLQNMQEIENDLWRVLIMLAWKAAMPPMANTTGRIITRRNLMAGEILEGINAAQLQPIFDGSLANTGFLDSVLGKIRDNMTSRSVPEMKQGQVQPGLGTATEAIQIQKEAETALFTNLSALAAIQGKADRLRASNIIQFMLKPGFRANAKGYAGSDVSRKVAEVVEELSGSTDLMEREDQEEKETGEKVRIVQVKADAGEIIDRMETNVVSRPRSSSAIERQELMQMFSAAGAIFGQRLKPDMFEEMFRQAYRVPRDVRLTEDLPPAEVAGMSPQPKQPQLSQAASLEGMQITA